MNNEEIEKNSQEKRKIRGEKDGEGRSRRKRGSRKRRKWRLIWRVEEERRCRHWGINTGK